MTWTLEAIGVLIGSVLSCVILFYPVLKISINKINKQLIDKMTEEMKNKQTLVDDIDTVKQDFEKHQLSCRAEMYLKFSEQDKTIQKTALMQENFQKIVEKSITELHDKVDVSFTKIDKIYNKLLGDK